ncbi:Phospho-N-acetylmuramoyl-pentapeptide-transferase [Candidatus Gugararchaeum adminiculabundum]|nr:Phospho-N-acetylmuramoyl-pentapeptide-transferase [Candidatus Gugararchaeum adminiculabundum]
MNTPFEYTMVISFIVSFATVLFLTPFLIRKLKNMSFTGPDMNKEGRPQVPRFGGISIALGFVLAALLAMQLHSQQNIGIALAAVLTVVLIAFLGFVDDVLKIRDLYRVVLPAIAALPLMVVKAGTTTMELPLIGLVNFNLGTTTLPVLGVFSLNVYALVLIPIAVIACSNLINLLGGFNGLETGSGVIICATLLAALFISHAHSPGTVEASLLLVSMLGACIGFLFFNWHPAKVFPGNITTYMLGAMVVSAVVIGNIEKVGVIVLIPQIIEFFLKARGFFQAENFATPKGNRLHYEGQTQSLTHLIMKKFRPTEVGLVLILLGFQLFCGLLAIASLYV